MPKFQVQRSIHIGASPEKIYDTVVDYGTWTIWSPWLCAEPDAKVTITGEPSSVGAVYAWDGEIVGAGEVEHQNLEPNRLIEDELRFTKPFKSKANASFEIESVDDQTKITWHMQGSMPWFLFWMIPMMKTFIGMDYDRGLKMLKEWIETGEILSTTTVRGVESVEPFQMIGIRKTSTLSEIGPSMEAAFAEVVEILEQNKIPCDGACLSVYHKIDFKTGVFDYTSGFVVPANVNEVPSGLSSWSIPQVQALVTVHIGSYDNLGNAWSAANQHARYKKLKQSKHGTFEIYRNAPCETPPAELKTEIYLPLK